MHDSAFVFDTFILQDVPESSLHRLDPHRELLLAWARIEQQPLRWIVDPGRDAFLLEAPCLTDAGAGPQPVPVFLLGRRGDLFSVEFYDYSEKYKAIDGRFHYKMKYRQGLLRLPERLADDAENILGLVYDAMRAFCETKVMLEDAKEQRETPSLLEVFSVDVAGTAFTPGEH